MAIDGTIKSSEGFYIGDICYVLGEKTYYGFWDAQKHFEDGVFEDVHGSGFGFAVAGTAYGDGCYDDNQGYEYPVDAGVIGAIPLELIRLDPREDILNDDGSIDFQALMNAGRFIPVKGETKLHFSSEGGRYEIDVGTYSTIEIDTDPEYEDEEDDEYYDEDDEEEDEDW